MDTEARQWQDKEGGGGQRSIDLRAERGPLRAAMHGLGVLGRRWPGCVGPQTADEGIKGRGWSVCNMGTSARLLLRGQPRRGERRGRERRAMS